MTGAPGAIRTESLPRRFGGDICLDFVNTVEPRLGEPERDYLAAYPDLVRWARKAEILTQAQEQRLLDVGARRREAAVATVEAAIDLREVIYRIFAAAAQRTAPAAADLAALQRAYVEAMRHARLVLEDGELAWAWDEEDQGLDRMLWPIARAAAELATSARMHRVKQCPLEHGGCGWLFVDATRNATRRWCSMDDCGGRAKARRQYARRRAAGTTGDRSS